MYLAGKKVRVYIISKDQDYTGDFETNFNMVEKLINKEDLLFIKSEMDIDENVINDLKNHGVVIDGVFGVGLNKELTGMFLRKL